MVDIGDNLDHHNVHHDPVMSLDLDLAPILQRSYIDLVGSVDGMICLWQSLPDFDKTYICNPVTRQYMILSRQECYKNGYGVKLNVYGFGVVSKKQKNEYKVIRIFQEYIPRRSTPPSPPRPWIQEAEVYTLGMAHWRSLGRSPYFLESTFHGLFLNGHVHWVVIDDDSPELICAFDLDKETFQLFPSPPCEVMDDNWRDDYALAVLNGCVCLSHTNVAIEFTIWVMKEYGVKKSWHKEVVIKEGSIPNLFWLMRHPTCMIECLKDGTILMRHEELLLAYCPERKTVEHTQIFDIEIMEHSTSGMPYRPSFIKLQNFELENVRVF